MKATEGYVGIVILSVLLSSCMTTQVVPVPIDQMEPGKVNLPEKVRKVALLSSNFKFAIDTLGQYYNYNSRLRKASAAENKGIDSIAVTKCFESLRKNLLESGRYDEIEVYPYSEIKPHKGKNAVPLSQPFVSMICKEDNTDAVVSLEMLSYFYSINSGNRQAKIPQIADVKITAIWAVYLPGKTEPLDRFKYADKITWNENRQKEAQNKSTVPSRVEGIKLASDHAAKNYLPRLAPYWAKSERRIVSLDGTEWDKAKSLAQKYKWSEAEKIWRSLEKTNNKKAKGAASLNLAVAWEMLGDYNQAEKWCKESANLANSGELKKLTVDYAKLLRERRAITEKLNRIVKQ
jgi:hypothetical protein